MYLAIGILLGEKNLREELYKDILNSKILSLDNKTLSKESKNIAMCCKTNAFPTFVCFHILCFIFSDIKSYVAETFSYPQLELMGFCRSTEPEKSELTNFKCVPQTKPNGFSLRISTRTISVFHRHIKN